MIHSLSERQILVQCLETCIVCMTGTEAVSGSSDCHLEGDLSRFQRMPSVDSFNQRSHPNEMLTGLRYFERGIRGENGTLTKVNLLHFFLIWKSKFGLVHIMFLYYLFIV